MIVKESIETQYGAVETKITHCDNCGEKALIDGALRWLELRHLDRDVPPLHFCRLRCVVLGVGELLSIGVEEMRMSNWPQIEAHASRACTGKRTVPERKSVMTNRIRERFWVWLAWKLPRPLVRWCAYRVSSEEA